jgi:dipeptidyl aminopeptidase/acylaminoacyl peptidase
MMTVYQDRLGTNRKRNSQTGPRCTQQILEGWLLRPAGWEAGKSYPAILNVHGGPHGMHGYVYNAMFQALAGAGYAVILLNPRGSNGYGQVRR